MAKQIYNYELFTNKKDELAKIRKKAARNRRIKILLLALILAGTAIVAYILFNSKCNYYTYKDKVDTEDSGDVSYEDFDEGYLKYSSNGIEYQKQFIAFSDSTNQLLNKSIGALNMQLTECRQVATATELTPSAWARRAKMAPKEIAARPMPRTTKGSQRAGWEVWGIEWGKWIV